MKRFLPVLFVMTAIWACTNAKKFTSIRCVYDKDAQLRPGAPVAFGVVAQHKNGKKILTKGYLKGKYKMDNYEVTVVGGWSEGGIVFVDTVDNREVNRSVKVYVKPVKKQSLQDSFEFQLNYEGIVTWNFNGEDGQKGDSKGARILPIKVFGTALSGGKPGDSGTAGKNGENLVMYVYKIHNDSFYTRNGYDLFAVRVTTQNGGNDKFTFIAEKYGKLILKANGGNGGAGGDGGRGPNGSDATDRRAAGYGAEGGSGGVGGNGGNGGKMKIFIDTGAREFLKYVEFQNRGGEPGTGGKGGAGGKGGTNKDGTTASDGRPGPRGSAGARGTSGGEPEIIYDYVRF